MAVTTCGVPLLMIVSIVTVAFVSTATAVAMVPDEYPLQLVLTLKSYSAAADNNNYKCGAQGGNINLTLCSYQLQVEVATDGVVVGYELFDKQLYSKELKFEKRQEMNYRNPIGFNLTSYPHNVTVTLTLHYYSADMRKIRREFRGALTQIPTASAGESVDETFSGPGWSSFVFNVKLSCRPNFFGPFCSTKCRAKSLLQYCNENGQLLCLYTGTQPPCSTTANEQREVTPTTKSANPEKTIRKIQPLPPSRGGSTQDSLQEGNQAQAPIDPLALVLLLCGSVLLCVILVASLIAAACVTSRRKQLVGNDQCVQSLELSNRQSSSAEIQYKNDGVYGNRGWLHSDINNQQRQLQPPPPPAPLTSEDCNMLAYQQHQQLQNQLGQQRGSASGSSCLYSASVAAGYEPLRPPDGAEVPCNSSHTFIGNATEQSTTLPPPRPFESATALPVHQSCYGTGRRNRIVLSRRL